MIASIASRIQALQASDPRWAKTWMAAAGLLGLALAAALLVFPAWSWTMLAIAPLYLFVHRGEVGGRAGGGSPAVRTTAAAAPGPAAVPRGVALIDRNQRVIWCNECSTAHLGLKPASDAAEALAARGSVFPGQGGSQVFRSARGQSIAVDCLPFIDSDWLLISRELAATEESGRGEADASRGLLADASHELRNPLCVMMGLLETVTELDLDGDRRAYYLNLMEQQGRRMQAIVEGLLKMSKLETPPEPRREDRVDMSLLLARVHAEAEVLSCGRHSISLDADANLHLRGNEQEISSVAGNLVSNAIRYTPPGGEIRVVWRASEGGAELAVEDTGVGIEPQHIPLLTQRFYRVGDEACLRDANEARSRDAGGGTGLGLSIVKLILQRHGARLDVASTPGQGSRFRALFPSQRALNAPLNRERHASACTA